LEPEEIILGDLPDSADNIVGEQLSPTRADVSPLSDQPRYKNAEEDDEYDEDLDLDELDPSTDASGLLSRRRRGLSLRNSNHEFHPHSHASNHPNHAETGGSAIPLTDQQQQQKMLLQCLLLEAGILFHSVFIGMALSVATGTSFVVLLVAISFHRKLNPQPLLSVVKPQNH
jgi:hypothetical protein